AVRGPDPEDDQQADVESEADQVDGEDPAGATNEEGAPAQRTERFLLSQGEGRDQEATQDEEERDSVPAFERPPEPVGARVVENDEQCCHRPETLEPGEKPSRAPLFVRANRPPSHRRDPYAGALSRTAATRGEPRRTASGTAAA